MKQPQLRYSLTQFTFWAASTGASSFATAYLLRRGLSSALVGTLLAAAGLLSCLTQPVLAGAADRTRRSLVLPLLAGMNCLCAVCFGAQLLPQLPAPLAGALYMTGLWSADAMVPLLNALCVSCVQTGYAVNYGAARGIGSAASALSSLVLGHVLAQVGSEWMLLLLIGFRLLCIVTLLGYPRLEKPETAAKGTSSCSVPAFFRRYRWYCVTLTAILFLGMYHAMTESYLIAILGRFGGSSQHVGTALFISSMTGAPVIFCSQRLRRFLSDNRLLKIAACSFLLRSILFFFAGSIPAIYLSQLLQATSYAFLAPTQVHFAQSRVHPADTVKGQAFSTAAYALGCSAGNFVGGQLLTISVNAMLLAGIGMALVGTAIMLFSVDRSNPVSGTAH